MKRMVDGLLVLAAVLAAAAWLPASATAQVAKEPPGFAFGGAPEFDCPPLPKDDAGRTSPGGAGGNDTGTVASQRDNARGTRIAATDRGGGRKTRRRDRHLQRVLDDLARTRAPASGGHVFTHEIDPEKVKLARENFKKAGVDDVITIIEGDAHETIKQHKEPIDVVFFDAEKKGYVDYLAQLLPQIRPGGLILGHDMHRPMPDPLYIEAITKNPKLDTSFLMMESFGISMTTKKR